MSSKSISDLKEKYKLEMLKTYGKRIKSNEVSTTTITNERVTKQILDTADNNQPQIEIRKMDKNSKSEDAFDPLFTLEELEEIPQNVEVLQKLDIIEEVADNPQPDIKNVENKGEEEEESNLDFNVKNTPPIIPNFVISKEESRASDVYEKEFYGYIKLEVMTANGTMPIEDALVVITKRNEDTVDLVRMLKTDCSGQCDLIDLEAPNPELASMPGITSKLFFTYEVYIYKDGYYPYENQGVEAYAGQTNVLSVKMIPLPDYASSQNAQPIIYKNKISKA